MMMYYTYILFSKKLNKYYVGHTDNLEKRFEEHNRGKSKFSRFGTPSELVVDFEFSSKKDAAPYENRIKKRGCKRFLERIIDKSVAL